MRPSVAEQTGKDLAHDESEDDADNDAALTGEEDPRYQDAVIKVHLYGAYFVSRAAATHFKEQNSGCYIHMTSTSGLVGNFGQANYAAAKLGIAALSKSIALDMQKFNVRSNCISPFAWSRMIGSIPTDTPEQQARVERMTAGEHRADAERRDQVLGHVAQVALAIEPRLSRARPSAALYGRSRTTGAPLHVPRIGRVRENRAEAVENVSVVSESVERRRAVIADETSLPWPNVLHDLFVELRDLSGQKVDELPASDEIACAHTGKTTKVA